MEHYNPNQAASNIWKYAPVDAANYKVIFDFFSVIIVV